MKPLFTLSEEREKARQWMNEAPPAGFIDLDIEPGRITIGINGSNDFLSFMEDNGIEYEDPVLVLCG